MRRRPRPPAELALASGCCNAVCFTVLAAAIVIASGCHGEWVQQATIHPPTAEPFVYSEHSTAERMSPHLGNALGADCIVVGYAEVGEGRHLLSFHTGDGLENADYFGWKLPLLAPFDAAVVAVRQPPPTNQPGRRAEPSQPAGEVVFRAADGTHVLYAHVRDITVQPGDTVVAGEPFAAIGNNGSSRAPHVHIGAWRGDTPLQIRFDLEALGRIRGQ